MPEEPLFEQLRRELEAPPLVASSPSQALYAGTRPAGQGWRWVKLGGSFAAGAVATAVLMAAGTGSANPQVWTIRVASALSQLGAPRAETPEPVPALPSPSGAPTATPEPSGSQTSEPSGEPAEGASPEVTETPGEISSPEPTLEPSATSDGGGGGGTDGGATDGGGGTDEGASASQPSPTPSPETDH
jgi:hypothetical protein